MLQSRTFNSPSLFFAFGRLESICATQGGSSEYYGGGHWSWCGDFKPRPDSPSCRHSAEKTEIRKSWTKIFAQYGMEKVVKKIFKIYIFLSQKQSSLGETVWKYVMNLWMMTGVSNL